MPTKCVYIYIYIYIYIWRIKEPVVVKSDVCCPILQWPKLVKKVYDMSNSSVAKVYEKVYDSLIILILIFVLCR